MSASGIEGASRRVDERKDEEVKKEEVWGLLLKGPSAGSGRPGMGQAKKESVG